MKYLNISDKIDKYDEEQDKDTVYFLDILRENMNIYKYINMLKNIEDYKYKNIINYINHKWIKSNNILLKKHGIVKYNNEISKIEKEIDFNDFNRILTEFIGNEVVISIFTINLINSYLF